MLIEFIAVYAVVCWIATLGFLAYGLIQYGIETKWTWRLVARIVFIVVTAPVSVPVALAYLFSVSTFSYKNHEN